MRRNSRTRFWLTTSRPIVGSSRKSTFGSWISALINSIFIRFPSAVWPKKADKFAFLDLKTHRVGRARLVVTPPHQSLDRSAQSALLAIGAIDLGQVASFDGTHCPLSAFLSHVQGVRAINLRPDGKLLHAIGISSCLAPKA